MLSIWDGYALTRGKVSGEWFTTDNVAYMFTVFSVASIDASFAEKYSVVLPTCVLIFPFVI